MKSVNVRELRALSIAALLVCSAASTVVAQTLPAPWSSADVGAPAVKGAASASSGTFTVDAAGTDIWGTSDQFHFVYRALTGDGEIVARVTSLTNTNSQAKAGVMFREALTGESRYAMMMLTPSIGYRFQRRPVNAGSTMYTTGPSGVAPGWVKVVRMGDLFIGYASADGKTWTSVGAETMPMGATVYIGLAVTSRNATTLTRSTFDSIAVKGDSGNQPPAVTLTSPVNGSQVTGPAIVSLAATASDPENRMASVDFYVEGTLIATDTAAPYAASWSASTPGTYSLSAFAKDSDGGSSWSSPASITVQAANNPPAVSLTSPTAGATFTAPATISLAANASDPEGQLTRVEFYSGTTLLASDTSAPYTFSWTNVPAGSYTLTAKAYDGGGAATTSAAASITVGSGSESGSGGTGSSLPAPWSAADVGAPTLQGSTTYSGSTFTINAAGTDIDGTADQFHFVYRSVTGDGQFVARVASLVNTNAGAKAGVMFRDALTGGGRYAMMMITAGNGYRFQRRPSTGGSTIYTTGPAAAAPGWVKVVRMGDTFIGYSSPDGITWTGIGAETIPMGATVYVGLAVTSRNATTLTRSDIGNITTTYPSGGNQSPSVTISAPANGTQVAAPATVAITASASDPENRMASVAFYAQGTLIATDTTAPYSASWSVSTPGTYSLTAVAQDADGGQSTSSPVSITVTGTNQAPSVSLTAPANGTTYTAPASMAMAASASDPEGQLARVEFYSGTTLLGTDTSAPYSFSWSNVSAGSYSLRAVAYDSAGASASSAIVSVTVQAANAPPTVTLTSPTSGSAFTAPASIALAASASDAEGQLARVEFYSGTTLLGTDTSAPYSFSWSNVPAGTYSLTARAYDAAGASATSAAVSVTVSSTSTSAPTAVVFTASADHATNVTSYQLKVFAQGANPSTATPVAASDLGKPTPDANNDITVNRATFFAALPAGNYLATVTAIGSAGQTQSSAVSFTR